MQRMCCLICFVFSTVFVSAQVTEDLAVELWATTQVSPPRITLHWKKLTTGTPAYTVYRKAKTAASWGTPVASLTATDSFYVDATVIADSGYEYEVLASGTTATPFPTGLPSGYIYAAIRNPAVHNKGTLILMVDSTITDSCAAGLKNLMQDISGDGWQLVRHDISRSRPLSFVTSLVAHDYAAYANVQALLLLGHIAVPYSGGFDSVVNPPDGHVPYHDGAWPADVYYACMTGWTDATVNNSMGSYSSNWNVPGDGKWDQINIPSPAVLQVGRVDFWNMPSFAATEVQLMNRYLAKDHVYKMDSLAMRHRAVLHDDFGYFGGEGFAANGWRNFSPLVTRDSLTTVGASQLITTLAAGTYQWAYGCGGGSFTSAGGIGVTGDFAANAENGIFTMMFGSYFGDWNVQDNFLRAPLCANPPALTNCWAGRPNWFFHHMALGENIGYSAMLTQNNDGTLYQPANYGAQWVHVALMGDLTLRTDYIKPVTNLAVAAPLHNGALLTWTASPDPAVLGYYVYRADSAFGYFQRLSPMIAGTSFHDTTGHNGLKYYMVRPVKLQATPSGGYYNLGIGVTDTAHVSFAASADVAAIEQPVILQLYPNPATENINVTVTAQSPGIATLKVLNAAGQQMYSTTKMQGTGANVYSIQVSGYPTGIYQLVLKCGNRETVTKWVKR